MNPTQYIYIYIHELKENSRSFAECVDIILCTLRYGASPNNYRDFGYQNLSAKERSSYVTHGLSQKMIRHYNNRKYIHFFEDKVLFANTFQDMFCREYLATDGLEYEKLKKLYSDCGKIIYKPSGGSQGQGIAVYDYSYSLDQVFEKISQKSRAGIIEEWIEQHEALNAIYSEAINCLRVITVFQNGEVKLLSGGITWGNGEQIANASASGIVSPVCFESGCCEKPAADFSGAVYYKHPITGAYLVGFEVPFWREVKEMLNKAARRVPEVRYVGWDIAITPNGPILIEGNTTPGYRYYQIPAHMTSGTGNRQIYEECLKTDLNKNKRQ